MEPMAVEEAAHAPVQEVSAAPMEEVVQQPEQQQQQEKAQPSSMDTAPAEKSSAVHELRNRLALIVKTFPPSLYKKGHPKDTDFYQDLGVRVPEWGNLRRGRHLGMPRSGGGRDRSLHHIKHDPDAVRATNKMVKAAKQKGHPSGRTYTSKFRGVHQTFPTRRWEAQFRKNGKPTSLGCFDHEDQAARAYDRMMLWCELHNITGIKGGITNFDPSEYEKDLAYLQSISQDQLIEALRSDGRRQAAHRMMRFKRASSASGDEGGSEDMRSDGGEALPMSVSMQTAMEAAAGGHPHQADVPVAAGPGQGQLYPVQDSQVEGQQGERGEADGQDQQVQERQGQASAQEQGQQAQAAAATAGAAVEFTPAAVAAVEQQAPVVAVDGGVEVPVSLLGELQLAAAVQQLNGHLFQEAVQAAQARAQAQQLVMQQAQQQALMQAMQAQQEAALQTTEQIQE